MNTWLWIAVLLFGVGVPLMALRLWGSQIIAGLVTLAAAKAWEAFKANANGVETPAERQKHAREGTERGGKDR